jgi:hypothetical protein
VCFHLDNSTMDIQISDDDNVDALVSSDQVPMVIEVVFYTNFQYSYRFLSSVRRIGFSSPWRKQPEYIVLYILAVISLLLHALTF